MIRKYIDKLFGRRERVTHKDARPVIYGKDKHAIRRESISRCARRTCEELQRAGFAAFVVGGAVRDLLLGITPKDFDIATSATPDQVRSTFRRSRIGRRFQIARAAGRRRSRWRRSRALHPRTDAERRRAWPHALRQRVRHPEGRAARIPTVNALFYEP